MPRIVDDFEFRQAVSAEVFQSLVSWVYPKHRELDALKRRFAQVKSVDCEGQRTF